MSKNCHQIKITYFIVHVKYNGIGHRSRPTGLARDPASDTFVSSGFLTPSGASEKKKDPRRASFLFVLRTWDNVRMVIIEENRLFLNK